MTPGRANGEPGGVILRSGPANSETAEMGVLTYLGWLVLAGVETRWNVMGGCPPSRMQKLYLASCGRHDELGMCSLNLLTKVTDLTLESLERAPQTCSICPNRALYPTSKFH